MGKFIPFILSITAAFGQNAAVFPHAVATPQQLGVATNQAQTTLLTGITATDTILTVASSAPFKAGSLVTIGNEIIAVCGISGDALTVGYSSCPNVDGRGMDTANGGGAATSHSANATVQARIVAWHINQIAAEVIALESSSGGGSVLMSVSGTLAIGSDLAPIVWVPVRRYATGVKVMVKHAPVGAALTCKIYLADILWMTLTIPDGDIATQATADQIAAAVPISGNVAIRLDITSTGSTYPGGDISAMVFF